MFLILMIHGEPHLNLFVGGGIYKSVGIAVIYIDPFNHPTGRRNGRHSLEYSVSMVASEMYSRKAKKRSSSILKSNNLLIPLRTQVGLAGLAEVIASSIEDLHCR